MNMKYAKRSEDTEQCAVIEWAQTHEREYPELKWLHHCPNGGSRNRLEAVKLKQMGVKAGVSDLHLPYPRGFYCGLYIEMKYGNNRQQDTQKEFLADMAAAGHYVATCYSMEEAVKVLEDYLKLRKMICGDEYAEIVKACKLKGKKREFIMQIPNNSILKNGKVKGAEES